MKKLTFLTAFVLLTNVSLAQGKLMNKLLAKVASKMGDANTMTTSTLDDATLTVGIGGNLHPKELGTVSQSFYKDWTPGGDQITVMVNKKDQAGLCKVDGTVTIDGVPVEYITGSYSLISAASAAPRKIEVTTSSGQKSSFTIAPGKKQLKVLSINGQKDDIKLDLTKDVVVELDVSQVPENTMLKVSMAINQLSIKSQYDVCYLRSGSTITIPAAAFRNINLTPAGKAVYSYKNSFLWVGVDEINSASDVSGSFASVNYTSQYSDGKFINVSKEPDLNNGLTAKGTEKLNAGDVSYDFFKPNAFMSRPSDQLRKVGIMSFAVSGKTISENTVGVQDRNTDEEKQLDEIWETTTVTFPQQSDAVWAAVAQNLYPEIVAIIEAEFNASVLPIDAVANAAGYRPVASYAVANKNTSEEFSIAYQNARPLSQVPNVVFYGVNSANEKIMKELGADALMTFALHLQAEQDGDFGVLIPTITFEINGKINGTTNTKYFTGTVVGKGIRSDKIGLAVSYNTAQMNHKFKDKIYQTAGEITPAELDQIIRRSDLLAVFAKGLKEIKAQEVANSDYQTVWNLQK